MRNLLVTGGAGFIGSHFVRSVLTDALPGLTGARVTVLDKLTHTGNLANLGPVAENDRLDLVPGDITETALIDAVLPRHDAVVHCAAERSPAFATTTVAGTQILLDAAVRHGTTRVVQVSTDAVYGSIVSGTSTERSPLAPASPYAATKAAGDLLALAYHHTHELPVVVTRSANSYGPYQPPGRLIPRFVTNLLAGRTVRLHGDGGHLTNRDLTNRDLTNRDLTACC